MSYLTCLTYIPVKPHVSDVRYDLVGSMLGSRKKVVKRTHYILWQWLGSWMTTSIYVIPRIYQYTPGSHEKNKNSQTTHHTLRSILRILGGNTGHYTETEMLLFWRNFHHWLHWSCHFDNFQCSQWWKFRQNDNIFVSVLFVKQDHSGPRRLVPHSSPANN